MARAEHGSDDVHTYGRPREHRSLDLHAPGVMDTEIVACEGCGRDLGAAAHFCGSCGQPTALGLAASSASGALSTPSTGVADGAPAGVACRACGRQLPGGASFCMACGSPVSAVPVGQHQTTVHSPAHVTQPLDEMTVPAHTAEPGPRRGLGKRILVGAVIGLALGVVTRMLMGVLAADQAKGDLVAQLPVGPEGGAISFDGGGEVKIPEGALSERATIEVRRTTIDRQVQAIPPGGGAPMIFPPGTLVAYTFGPTTLVFQQPVTIVLPVPPGQQGFVFISANGQIVIVPGAAGIGTVTVQVNSFDFSQGTAVFVT